MLIAMAESQKKKPKLKFAGFSTTLVAVSDPTNTLAAGECCVVSNGKVYVGKCVVWRYPCHGPQDIELQTAVVPASLGLLPDNCLVLSRHSKVNSGMAGGDLDGDLNMITFAKDVVSLVEHTEAAVKAMDVDSVEESVLGALQPRPDKRWFQSQEPDLRFEEYCCYARVLPTLNYRGMVCALAERATMAAMFAEEHHRHTLLHNALLLTFISHRVLDAPKKYTGAEIMNLALAALAANPCAGIASQRCSDFALEELRLDLPCLTRSRAFESVLPWLNSQMAGIEKGQLWLPLDNIVLGYTAGYEIMHHLLNRPKGMPYHQRTTSVSMLDQVAKFVHHKLQRQLGKKVSEWHKKPVSEIEAALHSRMTPMNTLRALLDSMLG